MNLKNVITTYDRFYNSRELMVKTMYYESFSVIRGKTSVFKKEQNYMKRNNLTDATFDINLTDSLIKTFRDEYLQEFARKKWEE